MLRFVFVALASLLALVPSLTPLFTAHNHAQAIPAAPVSSNATSSNGDFTLTKKADKNTVAPGGETVTYTYTVTNNRSQLIYYVGGTDDKCPGVSASSGLTTIVDPNTGRRLSYITGKATATFTCSTKVTQTTSGTAKFTFAQYFTRKDFDLVFGDTSSASAQVTVTVGGSSGGSSSGSSGGSGGSSGGSSSGSPGALNCNSIWYSSDDDDSYSRQNQGTIGTVSTSTGRSTPVFDIGSQTGNGNWVGSAAVAIDPSNPDLVYFIARNYSGYTAGPLYVYDTTRRSTRKVADAPSFDTLAVRLAADPSGRIWSVGRNGHIAVIDTRAPSPRWEDKGVMQLDQDYFWGVQPSQLGSGDIAFDGNGTMYLIAATNNNGTVGYLLSLSPAELAKSRPMATYIGKMGNRQFNGIAFDPEGRAYATDSSNLYRLDIETAATTLIGDTGTGGKTADLTSCVLPKPELRVTKTASTPRPGMALPNDTITWNITLENIGTFAATNVTFQDSVPGMGVISSSLNGGGNLGADYYATARFVNSPGATQGIIKPGESATISLKTKVPGTTSEREVCNQGSVRLTGFNDAVLSDDPSQPSHQDSTCVQILHPAIKVEKKGTNSCIMNGGPATPVRATYTVTNPGNDPLNNITVSDTACGTPVYASGDANGDGYLDPEETWVYACDGSATEPGSSTATASGTGRHSSRKVSGTGSWTLYSPVLTAAKTSSAGGEAVAQGQELTYTVTVTNTGNKDAEDVRVEDAMPAGVTFVPGSITRAYRSAAGVTRAIPGAAPKSPGTLAASSERLSLKAGESMVITFKVTVNDPLDPAITAITNAVTASFAGNCSATANVTDQVARFDVRKWVAAGGQPGGAGTAAEVDSSGNATVEYRIRVDNNSPVAGKHLPITDTVTAPEGFSVTKAVFTRGTSRTGEVVPVTTKAPGVYVIPASPAALSARGGVLRYTVVVTFTASNLSRVDWAKARTCSTDGAGDAAAGGAFNTVTMPGDGDGADNNDACAPLIPPHQAISLQKQSLDCPGQGSCLVTGSQFALYDGDPANGGTLVTSGITADTPGGARFTATGIQRMRDYWLVETKAPAGHELLAQPVRFSVTFTGITLADGASDMVKLKADDPYTIVVSDARKVALPFTGGAGRPLTVGGTLLAATGIAYLLLAAWRNRRGGEHAA